MPADTLYYGNNLDILRRYLADESVDPVYLDPPFNPNAYYPWHWTLDSARQSEETVEQGGKVAEALHALRHLLGTNDMLAYLTTMAPRLVELRRVLKPT